MTATYNPIARSKGPIIGLLVKEAHKERIIDHQNPLPKHLKLIQANQQFNHTMYFFSVKDLKLSLPYIIGIFYNSKTTKWEKKSFPLPDLIYKCYGSNNDNLLRSFEKKLKTLNIKNINYLYCFSKWEIYLHLSSNINLTSYLPFTTLYKDPDSLKDMLNRFNKVYLKSCFSGGGRGVICVEKMLDAGFRISHFKNQLYINKANDFDSLIDILLTFYKGKKFIIQEAIDLLSLNQKVIDIRSELQRNGDGTIIIAGMAVRVSNNNTPITTHASSYGFESFFRNKMDYSEELVIELKDKINKLLIAIYESVEKAYGQSGELSIDIALDTNGDLWFIECNAYSSKVSFFNVHDKKTIDESYISLLKYSSYLYTQSP
ncbi:YheC/YheD family endospore coat-associated protein [Alkaliphilus peptidifermentans]|uniref:YheC/D like ATP-grasp n=1 Tax=Alkaliphilus peptidifermentans DSM 18978 TaxID=1120976 RepID=A0A1G5H4C2_9FIRM|nr:YheC/YheD family protein [Alkaliphilus peptidifermentans]SCY57788.1 YheC/D like ATP-grasp [Alkaliphilus peptidifermentans DSM 18978]